MNRAKTFALYVVLALIAYVVALDLEPAWLEGLALILAVVIAFVLGAYEGSRITWEELTNDDE